MDESLRITFEEIEELYKQLDIKPSTNESTSGMPTAFDDVPLVFSNSSIASYPLVDETIALPN